MTKEEREIRQRLKDDFVHYASKCLKIRTKTGTILPFQLNKAQLHVHNLLQNQLQTTGKVRALLLKGRQLGMSTYVGARYYHKVTHSFGTQAFILTHSLEATNNLFQMAKRFYEHTPSIIQPAISKSNAKELVFGRLDSGYKLGTAENKNVGRSATIQLLHASEAAFWSNAVEHSTGIFQAVPNTDGSEIIIESTANGVGNFFHQEWQKAESGESDYIPIFLPWFWQDEYKWPAPKDFKWEPEEIELAELYGLTKEQINWRRKKIIQLSVNGVDGRKSFMQEYPCNANEAFQLTGEDSYIPSDLVMQARKEKYVDPYGELVIGCDPARFGDDRTAIIRRRTRCAYGLEVHTKKDTMEITGILVGIIRDEQPTKVFVDVGGLGAGIVDRLNELGYSDIVAAVNAGAKPFDANKFKNKRAELWCNLKEWLTGDLPVALPDSDELHSDICGIKYKVDSNSRLQMESKEEMKKRGIRSSDTADALCLTFALPDSALMASKKKEEEAVAVLLNDDFNARMKALSNQRR